MIQTRLFSVMLGCAALFFAQGLLQQATAADAPDYLAPPAKFADPARLERLAAAFPAVDELMQQFTTREHVPGAAWGIVVDGRLAHVGVTGVRDVASSAPVQPDSVFRIASMTKSFTALAILRLRDQGKLSLDDRVDRFAVGVPDGVPVDSAVARINHVAFGFRAHKSADVAVQSSRTFRVVERFHRAIGLITVVASAVFLLCLLLLSVEERRRDIAALRLMGISQGTIIRSIVIEAAVVSVIGSAIGAGIGWVSSLIVNVHFQQVYRTPLLFALLTPEIFVFATLTSLVLGIGAGAVAAWRLVRTPPLTLLGR